MSRGRPARRHESRRRSTRDHSPFPFDHFPFDRPSEVISAGCFRGQYVASVAPAPGARQQHAGPPALARDTVDTDHDVLEDTRIVVDAECGDGAGRESPQGTATKTAENRFTSRAT